MARTLEEIGRQIGCSPATISRILNNSAPVNPEMREHVLRELRASGYQPRARRKAAEPRAAAKSDTVDVVMYWESPETRLGSGHEAELPLRAEDLWDHGTIKDSFRLGYAFFRHIIDGVVTEVNSLGYKAALQVRTDLLAPAFLADVMQHDNHGIVLLGTYGPHLERFVAACTRPLVLVDMLHHGWPDVVTIDNAGGIRQSFDHLVGLGHRDIGFISNRENPSYREREAAFRSYMVAAGLPVREEWVFAQAATVELTADGVERILAQRHRPSAFLCVCDYAAMGVIRAATRCGVVVPHELSVMGFDDMDAAALVTPALSTIRVPTRQLGRQAVRQLLVSELGTGLHREAVGTEIRVRTELVVRQSTTAPRSR